MGRITEMAMQDEDDAYSVGAEEGFWRGFSAGVWAMTRACEGENVVLSAPEEFQALGPRWYPIDHSENR